MTDTVVRRPYHLSIQLQGCGEITWIAIDLRLCVGFEGGIIVVRTDPAQPSPWTLHLTGSPSLTWWFHDLVGLYAGVAAGPALVRSNLYVGPGPGMDAIAERNIATYLLAGSLGLELRIHGIR